MSHSDFREQTLKLRGFCLTSMSITSLIGCALAAAAILWLGILAVL